MRCLFLFHESLTLSAVSPPTAALTLRGTEPMKGSDFQPFSTETGFRPEDVLSESASSQSPAFSPLTRLCVVHAGACGGGLLSNRKRLTVRAHVGPSETCQGPAQRLPRSDAHAPGHTSEDFVINTLMGTFSFRSYIFLLQIRKAY